LPASNDSAFGDQTITLVHGVYGAGKSYLIGVAVKFLAEVFEQDQVGYRPFAFVLAYLLACIVEH
jgi:hypothetical protein